MPALGINLMAHSHIKDYEQVSLSSESVETE